MKQDIILALRSLIKDLSFLAVSCLSLGIGFGLNITIAAAAIHLLLQPLPFNASRIVTIWESNLHQKLPQVTLSPANFFDFRTGSHSVTDLLCFTHHSPVMQLNGRQEEVSAAFVSSPLSTITNIKPMLGREFGAADFSAAGGRVVILSYTCWKDWFSGASNTLGRLITIDQKPYTVVGIMPPEFTFPYPLVATPVKVWIPSETSPVGATRRFHGYYVLGRLGPHVTLRSAQTEAHSIATRLQRLYPFTNKDWSFSVIPLRKQVIRDSSRLLALLISAAVVLLCIALMNVSIIWLSRQLANIRRLSIQFAVGASRGQVLRGLLIENIAFSFVGALIGVLMSRSAAPALSRIAIHYSLIGNTRVLYPTPILVIAAIAASIVFGVASGIVPALFVVRSALRTPLPGSSQLAIQRPGFLTVHEALAALQVFLSVMLLASATFLVQNYRGLLKSEFGRRANRVVVANIRPPVVNYIDPVQRVTFYSSVLERIERLPGVVSCAAVSALSLPEGGQLAVSSSANDNNERIKHADLFVITPGYFRTVGARITTGRGISELDRSSAAPIVIINETLRQQMGTAGGLGKQILIHNLGAAPFTIVGVVADIDHFSLVRRHTPELYVSFYQKPLVQMWLLVNTSKDDPSSVWRELRHTVSGLDMAATVTGLSTFDQMQEQELGVPHLQALLVGGIGFLAFPLTVLGVWGVIAYHSARRTREVAVRLAVGAAFSDVLSLFFKQALIIVATGLVPGVCASFFIARALRSVVSVPVSTSLPAATIVVLISACIITLASCYPALRVTRVNPSVVLKDS